MKLHFFLNSKGYEDTFYVLGTAGCQCARHLKEVGAHAPEKKSALSSGLYIGDNLHGMMNKSCEYY